MDLSHFFIFTHLGFLVAGVAQIHSVSFMSILIYNMIF
jgi:hypothetical protein